MTHKYCQQVLEDVSGEEGEEEEEAGEESVASAVDDGMILKEHYSQRK